MYILMDTHILIWALTDDPKLPFMARKMITDPNNTLYYSVVSVWETTIKHSVHPDKIVFSGRKFDFFCEEAGYQHLSLGRSHVYTLESLSREDGAPPHRDPFDKMLIAQAKYENMFFLTHDALLPYYNEPCILYV